MTFTHCFYAQYSPYQSQRRESDDRSVGALPGAFPIRRKSSTQATSPIAALSHVMFPHRGSASVLASGLGGLIDSLARPLALTVASQMTSHRIPWRVKGMKGDNIYPPQAQLLPDSPPRTPGSRILHGLVRRRILRPIMNHIAPRVGSNMKDLQLVCSLLAARVLHSTLILWRQGGPVLTRSNGARTPLPDPGVEYDPFADAGHAEASPPSFSASADPSSTGEQSLSKTKS